MRSRIGGFLGLVCLGFLLAADSQALANRVFVSARIGNDVNTCDDVNSPCRSFAGAVTQLNPNGEVIVLDSGGYGPVTITQGVTIEAPAGVTAFIHPSSGDAITINAPSAAVTLRGLVLNVGANNGIEVTAVGTLNVENCFITGFLFYGIHMGVAGRLNIKNTDVKESSYGVYINNSSGTVNTSIDRCHLDSNSTGFIAATTSPGGSTTTATNSTANNNSGFGWLCGNGSSGLDVLNLEFCNASGNSVHGIINSSDNVSSALRYSNCVFANNAFYGVYNGSGVAQSRGNNTITGNGSGPTSGTIGSFAPM